MVTLKMIYVALVLSISAPFPSKSSLHAPRALEEIHEPGYIETRKDSD